MFRPVTGIAETEEVMVDVKNDVAVDTKKENDEIVLGEEAIAEDQDDFQKGMDADVFKEEELLQMKRIRMSLKKVTVAEEGVEEGIEDEGKMEEEEKGVSATDNDEEEPMGADEEKSLDTELETDEEATMADEEKVSEAEAMETELVDKAGKRKRGGRNSKTTPKPKAGRRKMTEEEDVCFICFDGGDLVLCDRRNCPKAYHPSCVNRDEAFFQTKGQWNCGCSSSILSYMFYPWKRRIDIVNYESRRLISGSSLPRFEAYAPNASLKPCSWQLAGSQWTGHSSENRPEHSWHLCSICEKKAEYMCYTCTFSLCKACIKTNVLLCVREKEKKGLCEACMKTVMSIEKDSEENKGNIDGWEYLFKDYWTEMKAKLNLTSSELIEAKNAWKGSELSGKQAHSDVKDDGGSGSENPSENLETRKNTRRRAKKRKSATKEEEPSPGAAAVDSEGTSVTRNKDWASKELLEFVMHMGDGNKSIRSQFDVQALLLEYIKTNNLRDSRRKSQIICDARLERLFGKPRVGHFEMLKLLESHFLIKEDSQIDDIQGSVVDTENSHLDDDEANETVGKGGKDRKRKMRKKGDREPQSNRDDYAAVDIHNISLIYLRRKLAEDLLDDTETFHSKVMGTFVRIRIPGSSSKQDIYRLVQVTGTTKAAHYALGKKTTDTMLEIVNLGKPESISIDTISNQDLLSIEWLTCLEECNRLRQSIKCGLINRLTVGDILDKAMELQAARVNDWLETEVLRLSHLRDRASDLGRKKEYPLLISKTNLPFTYAEVASRGIINSSILDKLTPEERARKLEEVPIVHDDPTMDPNCKSEEDTDEEQKKQDMYKSSVGSRFSRRREYPSKESWSATGNPRGSVKNYEFSRNNSFSNKVEDATTSARLEPHTDSLRDQGRDTVVQQPSILKKPAYAYDEVSPTKDTAEIAPKVNETEKMWHYKDPSGKIQGPFSMAQLRKWSNNKYFPADLRIWRKSEKEDDGILLTDALEGRFTPVDHSPRLQNSHVNWATTSVEIPKPSQDERPGFTNLPSPTPNQSVGGLGPHMGPSSYHGGKEELQSPTPNSSQLATSLVAGGNREPNAMGSFGNSATYAVAPQTEQQNPLQSSHVVAPPANGTPSQMVQSAGGQNLPVGPYGWSGGPLQPSLPSNVAGQQQLPYSQWGNAPNMVPNAAGNFLPQPPAPAPAPVNLQQAPPPPPLQPNVSWPTLPPNPNMGPVGPTPGNQAMNWGPTAQNPQLTGNVNPPWAGNMHPGWVPQPPAQPIAPNQGWAPGNGNPNWVPPAGNQGGPMNPGEVGVNQGPPNPSSGWVGNQGGNSNQGWGSGSPSGRNRGMWDDRSGFSGQKRNRGGYGGGGNRRQWDKGGSFNNRGRLNNTNMHSDAIGRGR
ncbi:hypothetical protein OSB04_021717, partial [Centaurea solstitialis]